MSERYNRWSESVWNELEYGERIECDIEDLSPWASAAMAPANCAECSAPLWRPEDFAHEDTRLCHECAALEALDLEGF